MSKKFKYTDLSNLTYKQLCEGLKQDWLIISRKLTDIIESRLANDNIDEIDFKYLNDTAETIRMLTEALLTIQKAEEKNLSVNFA